MAKKEKKVDKPAPAKTTVDKPAKNDKIKKTPKVDSKKQGVKK